MLILGRSGPAHLGRPRPAWAGPGRPSQAAFLHGRDRQTDTSLLKRISFMIYKFQED